MVCERCKRSVEHILNTLEVAYTEVRLGEVILTIGIKPSVKPQLSRALEREGFELLEDRDSRIINQIKNEVLRFVQHHHDHIKETLSGHLAVHLNKEYSSLSKLFSQVEGRTIEKYYIEQRIERVKELLVYDELNLSQIADDLGFSNVAHLSAQFKKVTGMTPTAFKKLGAQGRQKLDEV